MDVTNVTNFVVRNDTVNAFISEINKSAVPTEQEERDLFAKYEDAATEEEKTAIRNEIISRNLRFVYAVAKRYSTGDILPDLINVGMIGMYEAFEKYDWRSGNRFTTLAVWYIRRDINAYLTKDNLMVRPKNNVRIAPKVKKIENDFFLKNGRKPYPIEVMDALHREYGIDVKDEADIYGARVDRIDSHLGDDEDFTLEKSPVFNEKTAIDNEFDERSETDSAAYAVDVMMGSLNEREKTIISMAYGYGYPREYKDKEIGDAIGLTSERVRQIRHAAIKKMRAAYTANAD